MSSTNPSSKKRQFFNRIAPLIGIFSALSACAGIQANRSAEDFKQGPFHTHFSAPTAAQKEGPTQLEIRLGKIENNFELNQNIGHALKMGFKSRSLCWRSTDYIDRMTSARKGKTVVGSSFETGQIIGWGTDALIFGGTAGFAMMNPELLGTDSPNYLGYAAIGFGAAAGVFNVLAIKNAQEAKLKHEKRSERSLRPCGDDWSDAAELDVTLNMGSNTEIVAEQRENTWLVSNEKLGIGLLKTWTSRQSEDLTLKINASSKQLPGVFKEELVLTKETLKKVEDRWVCEALKTGEGQEIFTKIPPIVALKKMSKSACREQGKSIQCLQAKRFAENSLYDLKKQKFVLEDKKLGIQEMQAFLKECGNEAQWSETFSRTFSKYKEAKAGINNLHSIIETHDAFLPPEKSATLKSMLIENALETQKEKTSPARILFWNSIIKYLDDTGIPAKYAKEKEKQIKGHLLKDFASCTGIFPSANMPCIGNYINYIAAPHPDFRSQLRDQFHVCASKDMKIPKMCIHPLHEQQLFWGSAWKEKVLKSLRNKVIQTATAMVDEDVPPTKKINSTLIYMESWAPHLGDTWKTNFVRSKVKPILNEIINSQLKYKSKTSFESAAKMVQNYEYIFGHPWALKQKKKIDTQLKEWLTNRDIINKNRRQKLNASKCHVWRYPAIAVCGSRYMGKVECAQNPTINRRIYPDCEADQGIKCICGENISP